jgi:hypothetical protein
MGSIQLQIWVGDADRQRLQAHYVDPSIRPLRSLRTIVPEGPNAPDSLIDACIAFFPRRFERCSSPAIVSKQLQKTERLHFNRGKDKIPGEWTQLRAEARPFFKKLTILEGLLSPVQLVSEGE